MNPWQIIFEQSRVNKGLYMGDALPAQNWQWPRETWLQKRLRYLRKSNGYGGSSPEANLP